MALSLRLIEQTLVLGETGNFARAAARLGITQPTLTRNIAALEADTAKQVAYQGNAPFPGSRAMLAPELARGDLVCLDCDAPELRTRSALVRQRHRTPLPAALSFMQLLRETEAKLIADDEAHARPPKPCGVNAVAARAGRE
jgi:DNA-binding transcriptional LysR family regulator